MPVIGFLHAGFPAQNAKFVAAFRKGLGEAGYVEGQNVAIEFRWAEGRVDRLPELAADLVRRGVTVIATPLGTQTTQAAKTATTTIPIVFAIGGDPVAMGFVASFSRPGGNATGISILAGQIGEKRLSLLHDLVPTARHFAVLGNSSNPLSVETIQGVQKAAESLNLKLEILDARTDREIDASFADLVQKQVQGLLISGDEFFTSRMAQLATLSLRNAIPSSYTIREYAEAGGLMGYGPNWVEVYRRVGTYAGRILKGETPAELPVQVPNTFEFVINLRTAKALGLTVSNSVLSVADDLIE